MTLEELEARVKALEAAVRELQDIPKPKDLNPVHWWRTQAGRHADDPDFDEACRLGREYRESLHPDNQKKAKKKKRKAKKKVQKKS